MGFIVLFIKIDFVLFLICLYLFLVLACQKLDSGSL